MQKEARPFSVVYYFLALLLMIIAAPFIELYRYGRLAEGMAMTLVFLSAVLATGGGRRVLASVVLLAAVAVACKWLHYFMPDAVHPAFYLSFGMLVIGFTAYRLLLFILRSPQVDAEILCAGVATYLTLGLLWSLAYILVEQISPGSFSFNEKSMPVHAMQGFTALYFSFSTLCTVGYGDIVPASGVTRMLAVLEAGVGIFYVAILISRLVSLHSSASLNRSRSDKDHSDHEHQERK